MAKVTGPLFSVDARGKIADSLVFMGWRGLKTVRRWLVPHNPRTAAQVETRERFTTAVGNWATLSANDQAAWRRAAAGQTYSGFNMMVGQIKSALAAELDFMYVRNVQATAQAPGTGEVEVTMNVEVDNTLPGVQVRYGTTPALADGLVLEEAVFSENPTITLENLLPDTTYYFRVESQDPDTVPGRSGIYTVESPPEA